MVASQGELFGDESPDVVRRVDLASPLAEKLRPRSLEEVIGQEEILGRDGMLAGWLEGGHLPSLILWGPPGSGKTTIARALAERVGRDFVAFSAVLSGVKEVREILASAEVRRQKHGQGTVLFVDEIHRFNRSQQDAFLAHVESGTITLIGATTENPSFELNAALLSRCQVLVLKPHSEDSLREVVRRALARAEELGLPTRVRLSDDSVQHLARTSEGDARLLLNRLEALLRRVGRAGVDVVLDGPATAKLLKDRTLRYDKSGEEHFNLMSAFHKSLRGGDPQAALYWLARMMEGGEDIAWITRRMIRFASEDVGLSDPQALTHALAARDAYETLGSPEGDLALAQAAVYLATAPKSNAVYKAFNKVRDAVRQGAAFPVPMYLRNASTRLMKDLGYGDDYKYPHDLDHAVADQNYLPPELRRESWYKPSPFGYEKDIQRRMDYWDEVRRKIRESDP